MRHLIKDAKEDVKYAARGWAIAIAAAVIFIGIPMIAFDWASDEASGRHSAPNRPLTSYEQEKLNIEQQKSAAYDACDKRFKKMIAAQGFTNLAWL